MIGSVIIGISGKDLKNPATSIHSCGCSSKCIKKLANINVTVAPVDEASRLLWNNDGPDSSTNSLSVLVTWLITEPNYSRYRGSNDENNSPADGVTTKIEYCNQISNLIARSGIKVERSAHAIKII